MCRMIAQVMMYSRYKFKGNIAIVEIFCNYDERSQNTRCSRNVCESSGVTINNVQVAARQTITSPLYSICVDIGICRVSKVPV